MRRAAEQDLAARRDLDGLRAALDGLDPPAPPPEPEPAAVRLVAGTRLPDAPGPGPAPRRRSAVVQALIDTTTARRRSDE